MTAVFLDTVGLLARWDNRDQWHAAASAAYERLAADGRELVTSSFILLECGNAAARRPYRADVDVLRHALEADQSLVVPTHDDWTAAWKAYTQGDAAAAGIVDQMSFQIMRRLGLTEAFTNDRHFVAAGFVTLF